MRKSRAIAAMKAAMRPKAGVYESEAMRKPARIGPAASPLSQMVPNTPIVTPSTTALVADHVKAGRPGSAMGVFGTIWDSGEAAGPILAGFLIASLSYTPAFGLIAAFMAAMALLFLMMVKDPSLPIPAGGRPTA